MNGLEISPPVTELLSYQKKGLTNSIKVVRNQLLQNKVVGLGEAHWFDSVFQHWQSVVLNDSVLDVCRDIVLEAGNQSFQSQVDGYISGEESIGIENIQRMLMASVVFPVWFSPYYLQFFIKVREKNIERKIKGLELIRLHVMEPIFLWRDIQSKIDYLKINGARDEAFFRYVEQRFIKHNKPVIALMGARHLLKITAPYKPKNFAQLCEHTYPNRIFNIWPHIFSEPKLDELAQKYEQWLMLTNEPEIAHIDFKHVCPAPKLDGQKEQYTVNLADQVDGVLLMNNAVRHFQFDLDLIHSVDKYDLLHRAQYLNDKQQDIIRKIIPS